MPTEPPARLAAELAGEVLLFISPLLAHNDLDPPVRIVGGRARPRGIHAEFGRQVRACLDLPLRASPRTDYEIGVHSLVGRLVHDMYWPPGPAITLPAGNPAREIPLVRTHEGERFGVLRPQACSRLAASAARAGRFEDMIAFRRHDRVWRVGLHCPLPNQAGHRIRLAETPVGQFTSDVDHDDFGVPWYLALVMASLGPPLTITLGDRAAQFAGQRGLAEVPLVSIGTS